MLKFEARNSDGAVKIIDWSKVEFTDGQERNRPIKKLTLQVEAGGVAELVIERYIMAKDSEGNDIMTLNEKNESDLLTHKEFYVIDADALGDVIIKVVKTAKAKS